MSWAKNQRIATRRFSSSTPQPVGPFDLSFGGPARVRHELGEVLGVSLRNVRTGAPSSEPLSRKLAHRHEHAEAGFDVVRDDADEAVAGERVEQIQRLVLRAAADTRVAASSVHPSANTDKASASSRSWSSRSPKLHSTVARRVRWRSGRSRGPVPRASRTCSSRSSSAVGGEHSGASRGELDRERKPVEAAADLRDRGSVRVVQREVVANRPRAVHEETHRGKRRDLVERRPLRECRHRQRLDRVIPLSAESQQGAARGEDRDVRAFGEELIELGCRAGHLLEVVEHQQRRGRREVLDQGVERRARAFDRRTHRRGNSGQHERGIGDRRESDELRAASGIGERGADCDREPGLADASWAGQGDQPHVG